jgi:hypothetical protein
MRLKCLMGFAAASAAFLALGQSASAFDWLHRPDQAGWERLEIIRNYVYGPHEDRYAYFYDPRGYYPYYNSAYWGPPRIKRFNGPLPPYYGAWGATRPGYYHVEWHRAHYGGHRRGDW